MSGWSILWDDHHVTAQRENQHRLPRVKIMQSLEQIPVLVAAAQYSLLYLLFGGGLFGAAVIYVVAKAVGR
jgi:hypothetical protein